MQRLAFTAQMMQSSFDESSDGSWPINEISGSPLLSLASTNSDNSSDSRWVSPRIGDKFQVNVLPFMPEIGRDQPGMSRRMDYKHDKPEDFEQLFVEELPVPIMQICCFSPFGNGTFSDNEFHSKESSIKKDFGLCQLDLSEVENDQCTHEISNSGQLRDDNADCSITDLKTEFLRTEDTPTESTVAAENVLDISSYRNGHQRKKGIIGWKRVQEMKVDFLDLNKHFFDSNYLAQQRGMQNMGEDESSKHYMIVPCRPSASWSKSEEDLFILGLYIFGKNLIAVKTFVETKEMGDILSYYYGKFFKTESYCRWAEYRNTKSKKCIQGQRIFSGRRQQELLTRLIPHITEDSKYEIPEDFTSAATDFT